MRPRQLTFQYFGGCIAVYRAHRSYQITVRSQMLVQGVRDHYFHCFQLGTLVPGTRTLLAFARQHQAYVRDGLCRLPSNPFARNSV